MQGRGKKEISKAKDFKEHREKCTRENIIF